MKRLLLAATVLLSTLVSGARAASVLQPGGTLGVATGAPLPEGVFFNNISSLGNRDNTVAKTEVNLTSVVWSTPFSFYRTRLEFLYLAPTVATTNTAQDRFLRQSAAVRRLPRARLRRRLQRQLLRRRARRHDGVALVQAELVRAARRSELRRQRLQHHGRRHQRSLYLAHHLRRLDQRRHHRDQEVRQVRDRRRRLRLVRPELADRTDGLPAASARSRPAVSSATTSASSRCRPWSPATSRSTTIPAMRRAAGCARSCRSTWRRPAGPMEPIRARY